MSLEEILLVFEEIKLAKQRYDHGRKELQDSIQTVNQQIVKLGPYLHGNRWTRMVHEWETINGVLSSEAKFLEEGSHLLETIEHELSCWINPDPPWY